MEARSGPALNSALSSSEVMQYFTNGSFFPTEGFTSFIRTEMSIVPWSKRGSGKTVISTLTMFCLLWWPFSQSPPLKAGQREWLLHVCTALYQSCIFQNDSLAFTRHFGAIKQKCGGVKREEIKNYYPGSGHLAHVSGKARKGELFNIVWLPVLLHLLQGATPQL